MSKECKLTVALVLAVALAVYCAALVTISNFEHGGVITIDTFIGAGVGIIGVCATIMVGLQIWNHIEFKEVRDRIIKLDQLEKDIEAEKLKQLKNNDNLRTSITNLYVMMVRQINDPELVALCGIFALLMMDESRKDISIQTKKSITRKSGIVLDHLRCLNINLKSVARSEVIIEYIDDFKKLQFHKEYPDYDQIMYLHSSIVMELKDISHGKINGKIADELNELLKEKQNAKTKDAQPE